MHFYYSYEEADDTTFEVSELACSRDFIIAVFATSIVLSAVLIFAMQPIFTKLMLPRRCPASMRTSS
jgi:hypothetical protein